MIILIIFAGIVFAPISYEVVEAYYEKEPYTTQETYTVEEPFTTVETYYERESYESEGCIYVRPDYNDKVKTECAEKRCNVSCEITNLENVPINITYRITAGNTSIYDYNNAVFSHGFYSWIINTNKTESQTVNWIVEKELWFNCEIEPQNIEKCIIGTAWKSVPKNKTVIRYQNVTKLKDVVKSQDAYKERTVTKKATLYNIWTGKAKKYIGIQNE